MMRSKGWQRRKNVGQYVLTVVQLFGIAAPFAWLLAANEEARAIPVFARKYATTCITCHTIFPQLNPFGEAFRRNGFQFPADDDTFVREEPVSLGNEAYRDMFPKAIWPSALPSIPPVSIFALAQNIVNVTPERAVPNSQPNWDLNAPSDIEIVGAGTFGQDIGVFYDLGYTPQDGASVGRVFTQFSNLFAWSETDDEDGARGPRGKRFAFLPPRALNLRVGRFDVGVLPHVITEESMAQFAPLTTSFSLGANAFTLFAEQPAIELNGIVRQYWSYWVGIANGGNSVVLPSDNNTFKDVYFRVARRWWGFPMDGRLGVSEPGSVTGALTKPANDSENDYADGGSQDYWKWWLFETGVYGWFGRSNIPNLAGLTNGYSANDPSTFNNDNFSRVGVDARLWSGGLDIYGNAYVGNDPFPGFSQQTMSFAGPTSHAGYYIEADYQWNAWIMSFLRYSQIRINSGAFSGQQQARVVPGIVMALRQNMRLSSEIYINTQSMQVYDPAIPQSSTQWITTLWWAF